MRAKTQSRRRLRRLGGISARARARDLFVILLTALRCSDHVSRLVFFFQDRSIAVWDMVSQTEIALRRVLVGHRAAVNVVDFDEKYIVSASGDRTIKVWNTYSCEFVRTLNGHKRGIACLQYRDRLVVSGSSDNTIRLWDIECGACLRVLEGHEELVRCIRFDSKHIVSGAYDGYVCARKRGAIRAISAWPETPSPIIAVLYFNKNLIFIPYI